MGWLSTGLIEIMKLAAKEERENGNPTDIRYGTVVSDSPLKVQITSTFIIPQSMLVVPQHLTDYELEVTTDGYGWKTEEKEYSSTSASAFASHDHGIKISKKKIKIHNKLKTGDKVALLRQSGGQSYLVLDRV